MKNKKSILWLGATIVFIFCFTIFNQTTLKAYRVSLNKAETSRIKNAHKIIYGKHITNYDKNSYYSEFKSHAEYHRTVKGFNGWKSYFNKQLNIQINKTIFKNYVDKNMNALSKNMRNLIKTENLKVSSNFASLKSEHRLQSRIYQNSFIREGKSIITKYNYLYGPKWEAYYLNKLKDWSNSKTNQNYYEWKMFFLQGIPKLTEPFKILEEHKNDTYYSDLSNLFNEYKENIDKTELDFIVKQMKGIIKLNTMLPWQKHVFNQLLFDSKISTIDQANSFFDNIVNVPDPLETQEKRTQVIKDWKTNDYSESVLSSIKLEELYKHYFYQFKSSQNGIWWSTAKQDPATLRVNFVRWMIKSNRGEELINNKIFDANVNGVSPQRKESWESYLKTGNVPLGYLGLFRGNTDSDNVKDLQPFVYDKALDDSMKNDILSNHELALKWYNFKPMEDSILYKYDVFAGSISRVPNFDFNVSEYIRTNSNVLEIDASIIDYLSDVNGNGRRWSLLSTYSKSNKFALNIFKNPNNSDDDFVGTVFWVGK